MNVPEFVQPVSVYTAEVIKIHSINNMDVLISDGFGGFLFKKIILNEIPHSNNEDAMRFVESRLKVSRNIVYIQPINDNDCKYGNVLAWVWTNTVDGPISLNEGLKENGHEKV